MDTTLLELEIPSKLDDEDKLIHICYDDSFVALCGYQCTENVSHIFDDADCIVCVELDKVWDYESGDD